MEPFVAFVTLDHLLRLIRASADAVELDLVRVIGCHNHGLLALDGLDNWQLLSIFLDGWIQNGRHFFEGFWLFLSALLGLGLPIPGGRVLLLHPSLDNVLNAIRIVALALLLLVLSRGEDLTTPHLDRRAARLVLLELSLLSNAGILLKKVL